MSRSKAGAQARGRRRARFGRHATASLFAAMAMMAGLGLAGPAARAQARAQMPLRVPVVAVAPVADRDERSLTGEIVARDEVGLSFPMGGRLLVLLVREGDHVAAKQELARLESVQQEQALREAEAALEAAEADLLQARADFQRQDASFKRGATTRISRDEAERRLRIAEAGMELARANLDRARKTFEDTILKAPADGVITARMADSGEVVAAANPILKLALGTGLDAVFDAPEVLPVAGLADFGTIRMRLIDRPELSFAGHVREVSPLVDPRKGTVRIKVGVDDPPAGLGFGDAVRGFASIPAPPRIVVPAAALVGQGGGAAVWVVDPRTRQVRLAPIAIQRFSEGNVVVAEGLEDGDLVVAAGAQLLFPGRAVTPVEQGQ